MPVQRTPWNRSSDAPPEPGAASTPAHAAAPAVPPVVPQRGSATPLPPTPQASDAADRRSRAGAAWVGLAVGVLLMVLLVVFLLQNTAPVEVAFLGLRGTAPLAVTLLIAGLGFALVTLVVGTTRIGQLRRRVTAGDRARRAAPAPAPRH